MKRVGGGAFKRDFMPVGEGIQAGLGDKIWIVSRYIKERYTGLGDKIWIGLGKVPLTERRFSKIN